MKMTKKQAGERIKELREITAYHAKRYYDDDDPEISDFEYDMLMLELRNLENKYPEFISSESLTQHVGGTVKEGFEKVEHEVPLQSLLIGMYNSPHYLYILLNLLVLFLRQL